MIALTAILLCIAAIANSIMDTLVHHFDVSIFARKNTLFWNPDLSWKNKYKNGSPAQGARFPGSTTLFVFVTDGWHLFKFVMLNSYLLAVTIPIAFLLSASLWMTLGIFAGLKLLQGVLFNLLYHRILITNNPP